MSEAERDEWVADAAFIARLFRSITRREGEHGDRCGFQPKGGELVSFVNNYGRWELVEPR